MDIILLQNVENLGQLGQKVAVKAGYGRNYLLPTGRAVPANKKNLAAFESRRAELEEQQAAALNAAEIRKESIEAATITIARKAGDEGRLFGSVGTSDIARGCIEAGIEVFKKEVRLSEGPFHVTGEFEIKLHLHADVNAILKLSIVAEN